MTFSTVLPYYHATCIFYNKISKYSILSDFLQLKTDFTLKLVIMVRNRHKARCKEPP